MTLILTTHTHAHKKYLTTLTSLVQSPLSDLSNDRGLATSELSSVSWMLTQRLNTTQQICNNDVIIYRENELFYNAESDVHKLEPHL